MKRLSEYQAMNCEQATTPRCRCRCGGALHGAQRGGDNPDRSFFESLPEGDPHKINPKDDDPDAPVQLKLFQKESVS